MRTYTAKQLILTYHWAQAHPEGLIPIDRFERLTGTEWLTWFRACLHKKINRTLTHAGRKWAIEWWWDMRRLAELVNTNRVVRYIPKEYKTRLQHRLHIED